MSAKRKHGRSSVIRKEGVLAGVIPLLCWYWRSPRARIVERHRHWHHEFLLLARGTYEYGVRGKRHVAQAGDAVLYAPWTVHTEENPPDDPPEFYHVKFRWHGAPRNLPLQVHDRDGRMRLLATWLFERYWATTPFAREHSAGCLAAILAEYLRLAEGPEPEMVSRVRHYVLQHIGEPLTLSDLARQVHLNRYYFARRYRALLGRSPMHDVWGMRLAQARNLLLTTALPVKAIAMQVGFSSESALSHAMRKHLSVTPTEVRGQQGPAIGRAPAGRPRSAEGRR